MKWYALAFCLILSLPLRAQSLTPGTTQWAQEPTSFLGIKFGQPITASVAECPTVTEYGITRHEWVGFGRPCFELIAGYYWIYNVAPFFDVVATEIAGKVEYVSAKFNNGNAASLSTLDASGIAAALIEKFGPAHSSGTESVHNNAGAAYEDHQLTWKGKSVEIDFDSVHGEYNHGSVRAYTNDFVAHSAGQQQKNRDAVEGIF